MTNINCSSNCIYQKDGKCTLEYITSNITTSNSDCAYYHENKSFPFSLDKLMNKDI